MTVKSVQTADINQTQPAKRGRPRKYVLPEGFDVSTAFDGVPKSGAYRFLTEEQREARRMYDALRQRGRKTKRSRARTRAGTRHRNSPAGALPAGSPTMTAPAALQQAGPAPQASPPPQPDDGDELLPAQRMLLEIRRSQGLA